MLSKGVDEAIGGGSGADADDAFVVQFRQDEIHSGLCHSLLELVLVHAGSTGAGNIDL
jgi:hypothetical protein